MQNEQSYVQHRAWIWHVAFSEPSIAVAPHHFQVAEIEYLNFIQS